MYIRIVPMCEADGGFAHPEIPVRRPATALHSRHGPLYPREPGQCGPALIVAGTMTRP
jgi:hypothetical protein